MENFYKISKEKAALIGKFEYEKNKWFNPFVGEQKDGTYLVSEAMYELLKDHKKFQEVDLTKQEKITKEQVDTKEIAEINVKAKI